MSIHTYIPARIQPTLLFLAQLVHVQVSTLNPTPTPCRPHSSSSHLRIGAQLCRRLPCTRQEHGSSAAALPPLWSASPAASLGQDRHDSSAATPPPLHQAHDSSALEVSDSFPVFHPLIPLFLTSSDMNMAAAGDDLLCLFDLHRRTAICFVFLFSRRWQQ
jgi:hypothetical protein